jgi:hypothetical protein
MHYDDRNTATVRPAVSDASLFGGVTCWGCDLAKTLQSPSVSNRYRPHPFQSAATTGEHFLLPAKAFAYRGQKPLKPQFRDLSAFFRSFY